MVKLYGYKEEDVKGLANLLKNREGGSLSEIFGRFAAKSGKARGTVRNLYYAMAKLSVKDENFRNEYLGGKVLEVEKIVAFDEKEEKELVKKVLTGKALGKSVRKTIAELAEGNAKTALRLQNKFRGTVKRKPELIKSVRAELLREGIIKKSAFCSCEEANPYANLQKSAYSANFGAAKCVPEPSLKKLTAEINGLIERVAAKERRENAFLREKLAALEIENLRLKNVLYGGEKNAAARFFSGRHGGGGGAEIGS